MPDLNSLLKSQLTHFAFCLSYNYLGSLEILVFTPPEPQMDSSAVNLPEARYLFQAGSAHGLLTSKPSFSPHRTHLAHRILDLHLSGVNELSMHFMVWSQARACIYKQSYLEGLQMKALEGRTSCSECMFYRNMLPKDSSSRW